MSQAELDKLSTSLRRAHKILLDVEREIQETAEGRKVSPYEMLNLLMSDPKYAWLRKISDMMVKIDTFLDDPVEGPFARETAGEVFALFFDQARENDFKARLISALGKDASLQLELVELRRILSGLMK